MTLVVFCPNPACRARRRFDDARDGTPFTCEVCGSEGTVQQFHYCPRCGGRLAWHEKEGRPRRVCARCGFVFYRDQRAVVGVIILEGDQILLVKRGPQVFRPGLWCIPCGNLEWGEEVREAAAREVGEETGLEVTIGDVVAVRSNFHSPWNHNVGIWFSGQVTGGTLCPGDDASEARFFPLNALPSDMAFEADREVLALSQARSSAAKRG